MALITEEIVQSIGDKIKRAETLLESYKKEAKDHGIILNDKIGEIKERSDDHNNIVSKIAGDGNAKIKEYNKFWTELYALNSERAEIINSKRFNNKNAWEAFLGDSAEEVMQPYDMTQEAWELYLTKWREENLPGFEDYKADHDASYAKAMDDALVKIDAKMKEMVGFFADEDTKIAAKLEQAQIDTKEATANFKEKEEKLLALEAEIATTEANLTAVTAKHADAKAKYDSMEDGPSKDELGAEIAKMQDEIDTLTVQLKSQKETRDNDVLPNKVEAEKILADAQKAEEAIGEEQKDHVQAKEAINSAAEWVKEEHMDLATANRQHMISNGKYDIIVTPISNYIEEGQNSKLIRQREEEEEARKNIAESSIKDKRREKIILEFQADDSLEHTDFHTDTNIMQKLLKEELNITDENETKIQSIIREHEGEEGDFNAGKALELTRASLFDLSKSGVIDKIKSACSKGLTSVSFDTSEITGTEILGLIWKGYKITHNSKPLSGPNRQLTRISTKIIVEWGIMNAN